MAKRSDKKPLNQAVPIPKPLPKRETPETHLTPAPDKVTSAEVAQFAGIALQDPNTPQSLLPIIASGVSQAAGSEDEHGSKSHDVTLIGRSPRARMLK
jgi:hypothetical protein